MWQIWLSKAQLTLAHELGRRRHVEAVKRKLKDAREKIAPADSILYNTLGVAGEIAAFYPIAFNNPKTPLPTIEFFRQHIRINNFKEADIGRRTQVKCRRMKQDEREVDLCIRPKDKVSELFVHVYTSGLVPRGQERLFIVYGWIEGTIGKSYPLRWRSSSSKARGMPAEHIVPNQALETNFGLFPPDH